MKILLDETDRSEILRYLGYRGGEITTKVEEAYLEALTLANRLIDVKCNWKIFDITPKEEGLFLNDTDTVLTGKSIKKHLDGFKRVILFCVTIGNAMDMEIARQMLKNPAVGVCLNACGIQAVEKACDELQREIEAGTGCKTGRRFSPGYGDLPLELQKDFSRLLNMERSCGIRLNTENLMNPMKSVTAVCGLEEA